MNRAFPSPPPATSAPVRASANRRPRFAPTHVLLAASLVGGALFVAAAVAATRMPWFGMALEPAPGGLRVVSVAADGPSHGLLAPGDVLTSLEGPEGRMILLDGGLLTDSPFVYASYAGYARFFARHDEVYRLVAGRAATFLLSDGREVTVAAAARRPLSHIPFVFWPMAALSVLVLLVGSGVWAFRQGQSPARLVAVNSAAYMVSGLCIATYVTREWLLAPDMFKGLVQGGHFGNMVYGYSAMALFWYYPRPLGRLPVSTIFLSMAVLLWTSQFFQVLECPLHAYSTQYFPVFAVGVWFVWRQWTATRRRPDERAMLLWFVGPGLFTIGAVLALYFLPPVIGAERIIPNWGGQLLVLGFYAGIVLGILRFRLFDLDRWWFAAWVWFFGGLAVAIVDLGLVSYANLNPVGALTAALLLVGWIYFPVRQWVWGRFTGSVSCSFEALLPVLLETFFAASNNKPLRQRWNELLSRVFEPLYIRTASVESPHPHLKDDGMVLAVPAIEGDEQVLLSGRSRGRRLFNLEDVNMAALVLTLARKSAALREAQERGALVERERIARDLHDDVAPQLLTLTHSVENAHDAERARYALQTLRESIYALSDSHPTPLQTMLAQWRIETADRAEACGVELDWRQPERIPEVSVTPRQRLNLARVLREAVTNALRHAEPSRLAVIVEIAGDRLAVRLTHDGSIAAPDSWRFGKGLNNMHARIEELGGQIQWRLASESVTRLEVRWEFPMVPPPSTSSA